MHGALVAVGEREGHGKGDLATAVQPRGVVAEAHRLAVDARARAIRAEQLDRLDDLGDEHRALAFRRGREEVQVLPDRAADGAGDTDIMLESRPSDGDRMPDEIGDDHATLGVDPTGTEIRDVARDIAYDEAADAEVADEDVGTQSEYEAGDAFSAGRRRRGGELTGRGGIVQHVGGTADAERGVWSERFVESEPLSSQCRREGRSDLLRGPARATRMRRMHRMREINQRQPGLASRFGLIVLFALTVAAPARAQRAELARQIQQRVLANGLEVIVMPSGGVPIATVELVVKNGAFTQTPEYAGLAHLFEHMFFKANDTYPEEDAFMDRASRLGAAFNASTREELVNYYVTVVADSIAGGMEFLNAALRGAQFRVEELAREKVVVLGEYDRAESSPWFRLDERVGHRLWGDSWSRKNTIGDRSVINGVTPQQMRTIRDLYYIPNNSALIVAGDVAAPRIFALADSIFGSWPRGADPFVRAPIPEIASLTGNVGVIVEEPVNAVTVQIQWHGPRASRDEAATFAADVYSDILNQPASRFQRRLVDSGLWQGVAVNYYTLNHVGPITVSGQTTPEKLREAMTVLDAELAATIEPDYFTAEELEAVKANRAVTTAFGAERASENAHTIGFWWSVVGLSYHMRYIDEMAKQTPAQLQAYARRFIIGRPRIVGVMLPDGEKARLRLTEAELAGRGVTP